MRNALHKQRGSKVHQEPNLGLWDGDNGQWSPGAQKQSDVYKWEQKWDSDWDTQMRGFENIDKIRLQDLND